jgi:hypothetical protein
MPGKGVATCTLPRHQFDLSFRSPSSRHGTARPNCDRVKRRSHVDLAVAGSRLPGMPGADTIKEIEDVTL